MNNPYLRHGLLAGPLTVRRLVGIIHPDDYDRRTDPSRFTLREAIAHLADWEPILRGRIESALQSPGSTIQALDESERAESQNYHATDPVEQAEKWQLERDETVSLLDGLTADQHELTVIHPERGPMSVADMMNMLVGHDAYHVVHLTEFLNP
ncbi:MAG: DinB family protein [Fimbriimonadaceae bacterium]|nr:DinB family protein [Fimbriimonadaceae bacterium]